MKLEQKWHLIIHGIQMFTSVVQSLREGGASLFYNLIQGSTGTVFFLHVS
jgi:hypothetical protein